MKYTLPVCSILVAALLGLSATADAAKANWKKGRIYYRMVCTECHLVQADLLISPADKTKAEWADYFAGNQHSPQNAETKNTVRYYVSREYRESIKDQNRAAKKMLKVPDDTLLEDVKAFVEHTAKDSDQPSTCQ